MNFCRPHLRGADVIEEIEHALTKWSRYGVEMPRAIRLELCKVLYQQRICHSCCPVHDLMPTKALQAPHHYTLTKAQQISAHKTTP